MTEIMCRQVYQTQTRANRRRRFLFYGARRRQVTVLVTGSVVMT